MRGSYAIYYAVRQVVGILLFPGIVVHEAAHVAFCKVFGVRVHEVRYFKISKSLGYVLHDYSASTVQNIVIGLGPLLINPLVGFGLGFLLLDHGLRHLLPGTVYLGYCWLGISISAMGAPSFADVREARQLALYSPSAAVRALFIVRPHRHRPHGCCRGAIPVRHRVRRGRIFCAVTDLEVTDTSKWTGNCTMTPDELHWQKIEAHKKDTLTIIRRDFSASRMNTTKWQEVSDCLTNLAVRCRIKFVDVDNSVFEMGSFWHVTRDWFDGGPFGPFTSVSVEWLDIDPLERTKRSLLLESTSIDHTEELEKRLQAVQIPYHWENGSIRIFGHVRSNST